MQKVLRTGETYYGREEGVQLYRNGRLEKDYFDFINHTFKSSDGKNSGVIVVALKVTTRVLAQQAQQALNEEMAMTNEKLLNTNDELGETQWYLEEAISRLEESEARLSRFFMQAPAGICILDGEDFVFELVNPTYQQLFPDRELGGKRLLDALPELEGQPISDIL